MALGPVMLDIEGRQLTPADRALLAEPAVGGVILFSRNYESPSQLAELVAAIRALRSPPLLIAVDHEGGRVQRFRDGFSAIPPMRQLGRQYDGDTASAVSLAKTAGWLIATELRAMQIDLSFTPCVDLDWGVSDIIGNRAFHRNPDAVADLASGYCSGLREAGMAAVAKHFPGHGAVVADSHDQLPVDRRPRPPWDRCRNGPGARSPPAATWCWFVTIVRRQAPPSRRFATTRIHCRWCAWPGCMAPGRCHVSSCWPVRTGRPPLAVSLPGWTGLISHWMGDPPNTGELSDSE